MSVAELPAPSNVERVTPEQLEAMPESVKYELVDGQLVERAMSNESSWVGGELHRRLGNYAVEHGGWAFPDGTAYRCFADDGDRVRRPDASWICAERWSRPTIGICHIAPDLAVEVVSPNDLYDELTEKIGEYKRAGVRLIWIVTLVDRSVRVIHCETRDERTLEPQETLTGGDVLPNFEVTVGDLFPPTDVPTS